MKSNAKNKINNKMQTANSKKPSCTVRVIVNPTVQQAVKLHYSYNKTPAQISVKFYCKSPENLHPLLAQWRTTWGYNSCGYRVTFNWKGTPDTIKSDQKFKSEIYRIFGYNQPKQVPEPDYSVPDTPANTPVTKSSDINVANITEVDLAVRVRRYRDTCGNAPDFAKRTPKGEDKIVNYIRSVLGIPNLPTPDAIRIADLI